jgi:polar amino acid transport system substrate-binding protein
MLQTEKMASLGILVSGIAHEINNPTNFIMLNAPILNDVWKGSTEILDAHASAEPSFLLAGLPYAEMRELVPELFKGITDGAERIKNIVAGLKDYARQDLSDPYATTNVNEAVQASLLLLGSMIKKSTRKFSVDYGAAIPPVKGAKQKIEQVVINLVQNSCQALKSLDAAIRIKTSFEDGRVKVCVSDEGCGIAKESMPFIRDPFYTTKRDSGGTGLGLSISAGIVDELGGDMVFESTPGVGTIATISLPPASGVSSKPLPS